MNLRWAIGLPLVRVALVAAASTLTWAISRMLDNSVAFPPSPMLASVAMLPVNIISLMLVIRLLRREGHSIRAVLGFEPRRIATDLLWGLLWLVLMYVPFSGAIILAAWLQHGSEMFGQMQTMFFDPATIPDLSAALWTVLGLVAFFTFAPLNAPAEELVYRGWSQRELARRWRIVPAVVLPAAVFALQHIWYAPTADAMLAFMLAFFVWGICSGLIYLRQRRLMPLIFAHGLVNLLFTVPALVVPYFLSMDGA